MLSPLTLSKGKNYFTPIPALLQVLKAIGRGAGRNGGIANRPVFCYYKR
jgi:hypothetical protein